MKFELKERVLTYYGGNKLACVKCGFSDVRALSLDHMRAKSPEQVILHKASESLYRYLEGNGFPGGYQTLCMNCQFIKRAENNECRRSPAERLALKKLKLTHKYSRDKGLIPLVKGSDYFRRYISKLPLRISLKSIYDELDLDANERSLLRIVVMRMKKDGLLIPYAKGRYEKVV